MAKNFLGGFLGGVTAILLGTGVLYTTNLLPITKTQTNDVATSQTTTTENGIQQIRVSTESDITNAIDTVSGAVVSVVNMQQASNQTSLSDFFNNYYNQNNQTQAADEQNEDSFTTAGEGSGVIYKKDGEDAYVVTNHHVIAGSDKLEVIFEDGKQVVAELVGSDVWTDLAVLKISSKDVKTVATFADSDLINVGEPAIAIGSPLGSDFASTVTKGIVSANNRSVPQDLNGDGVDDWTATAIQTDAAINPGNSGGALVNASGQLIGINSMKISSSSVEGMGFAIPSNQVIKIISELESKGKVVRPIIGVQMLDVNSISLEQQKQVLNLPEDVTTGVILVSVENNSSASEAGLQKYDVIYEIDGEAINNAVELRKAIYSRAIGDTATIKYYRDGKTQTGTLTFNQSQDDIGNVE